MRRFCLQPGSPLDLPGYGLQRLAMQFLRPCARRLARAALPTNAATSSSSPSVCRPHSSFAPTRPVWGMPGRPSHSDDATKQAILKRPRKLPPGAPDSQLFLDLLHISPVRARPQLINEDSARALVKAWGVDKMQDVTVVDAYSGEGITAHGGALGEPLR